MNSFRPTLFFTLPKEYFKLCKINSCQLGKNIHFYCFLVFSYCDSSACSQMEESMIIGIIIYVMLGEAATVKTLQLQHQLSCVHFHRASNTGLSLPLLKFQCLRSWLRIREVIWSINFNFFIPSIFLGLRKMTTRSLCHLHIYLISFPTVCCFVKLI